MAVLSDYTSGTITVANGSVDFTGTGTLWRAAKFREGDTVQLGGYTGVIAGTSATDPLIESDTAGKFVDPWPGPSGTFAYRMRYLPDGARVTAQTTELIEMLGNGNLEALAALTPEPNANAVPVFTGPGATVLRKLGEEFLTANGFSEFMAGLRTAVDQAAARTALGAQAASAALASIAGLTTAADRMIYTTAADAYATTALTPFARTILDDVDAAAVRTTLELGSAATKNTGTSGDAVPLLNGTNTWSALQRFTASTVQVENPASALPVGSGSNAALFTALLPNRQNRQAFFGVREFNWSLNGQIAVFDPSANPQWRNWYFRQDGNGYAESGTWVNSSDRRIKEDISPIGDPLTALNKLTGCTWTRKDTGSFGVGIIAQDAEEAVPGSALVTGNTTLPDGTVVENALAIDTAGVGVAVLVEAVKALRGQVVALQARVDQLEAAAA